MGSWVKIKEEEIYYGSGYQGIEITFKNLDTGEYKKEIVYD